MRRQPFVARHGRPRIVPTTVGFQCVSGVSLASDDGRPREGRGAWRLSARCAFCSPYSPVSEHSALGAELEARVAKLEEAVMFLLEDEDEVPFESEDEEPVDLGE